MKQITQKLFSLLLVFSISGCIVNPVIDSDRDTPAFQKSYDKYTEALDAAAKSGKIKWVEAASKRRDHDKFLADNKSGYYTSWKFDSDDLEFHAYCIALAEKLDNKQITFAQYDSERISKFNQIKARSSSQSNQEEIIRLQRQNQLLIQRQNQQQQNNQNRTLTCDTYGITTTCR